MMSCSREVVWRGFLYKGAAHRSCLVCLECREVCKVNKHHTVLKGGKVAIKFEVGYLWRKRNVRRTKNCCA